MTIADFRSIALSMPEATEGAHMGHPDFRVKGKIFATLLPGDGDWGMVKLLPEQQRAFMKTHPEAFKPVNGAWGRRGATQVCLKVVETAAAQSAIFSAWCNVAPQRLLEEGDAFSKE